MRRPGLFSFIFLAATLLSVSPRAQSVTAQDVRYEVLATGERAIIDRIAADFYEKDLRQTQSEAIEDATTAAYLAGSNEDRAAFRDERRSEWREMTDGARAALRSAKHPTYSNLTDEQKAPFRRHAIDRLSAAGAIDENVLAEALLGDI